MLLALALVVYAFATNEEAGGAGGLLHNSAAATTRNVGISSRHKFLRWLPMTLFLVVAAQMFSERGSVPLAAISFSQRRQKGIATAERNLNVSYPYFIGACFPPAYTRTTGRTPIFFGLATLLAWALWPLRSRRFGIIAWLGALAMVAGKGVFGQHGIGEVAARARRLQRAVDDEPAAATDGRIASHDGDRPDRPIKIVRAHRHPARTEKRQRAAGLSARGQLPRLSAKANLVFRRPAERFYGHCAQSLATNLRGRCCPARPTHLGTSKLPPTWMAAPWTRASRKDLLPLPTGSSRLENIPGVHV